MKRMLSFVVLATVLLAGPAFAADPIVGTWKLDVSKSKFGPSGALTAGSRVYAESNGVYTLEQKLTGSDGKEVSSHVRYANGKEEKQEISGISSAVIAKKVNANTWDFQLKRDGKVVGHVHRVVSADGKTLTVHNTGVQLSGTKGDETLVFTKQ